MVEAVRTSALNSTSDCAISSATISKPFELTFSRKPSSNSGNITRRLGRARTGHFADACEYLGIRPPSPLRPIVRPFGSEPRVSGALEQRNVL
jgi:hypothetical protein